MIKRPKRSIKPPQSLKEYVVVAELDEEKTTDSKNENLRAEESKSIFKCKKCNIICKNKSEILSHLKRHKGTEKYVCEECGKTLSSLQAFSEHSNIHKNIKPYRCDVCGHESRQVSVHSRHMLTHEENSEKLFRCTVCSKSFKHKDYLKQHIRKHVGEKPYECNQCSKKFTAKSELNRHLISHSSAQPFSCQFCNKKFKLKHNLDAHIKAHTKSQVWKCCLCKASFPQQYLMEKHKKTHTEIVQHLELIKNDPRTISVTTCPLDRRKILHHQKISLPPKLDLNDSQNAFNSKMSLGLCDAFIPISVIASSFGTGNYIRMKIVDKVNLAAKNNGKNPLTSNGVTNAILVEDEVALKDGEWEQAVMTVDENNSTEENTEITNVTEAENQSDFKEKFDFHFGTFEKVFKDDSLDEDNFVWLQIMTEIIKDVNFSVNNAICYQLHTVIVKIQTILVNNLQEIKPNGYSIDLHAPSCESCNSCDDNSRTESSQDKELDNDNENKTKLKVELCNSGRDKDNLRKGRLKEMVKCFRILSDCLLKHFTTVWEL